MMKRAVGFLSIAAASVFVVTVAGADDRYGSGAEHGATSGATSGTASGTSRSGFMGQHMMTGVVKDVDRDEGKVKIEAEGKDLELHFPQAAVQNLNTGDRVTVQLAIKKAGGTTGSGTSGAGAGMHGGGSGTSGSHGGTGTGGGMR